MCKSLQIFLASNRTRIYFLNVVRDYWNNQVKKRLKNNPYKCIYSNTFDVKSVFSSHSTYEWTKGKEMISSIDGIRAEGTYIGKFLKY